eukprot:11236819-Karenia_brevis.AAC.1
MKADGKARRELHFFCRNYNATKCCDACFAMQPLKTMLRGGNEWFTYLSFGRNANHRLSRCSHRLYLQTTPDGDKSPWLNLEGCTL